MSGIARANKSCAPALALVLALAACGGDDDARTPDAGTDTDAGAASFIVVTPGNGFSLVEGETGTVEVFLLRRPVADVTIPLDSSDASELSIDTASLTFTPDNSRTPQAVKVTAVVDHRNDGASSATVVVGRAISDDVFYTGADGDDVEIVTDDATPLLLAADRAGDLYRVDQTTGAAVPVVDTFEEGTGAEIGAITSMVFDATTATLYATLGGRSGCPGCFVTIDLATGATTHVGDPGIGPLPGLAQRAADGAFFTASFGDLHRIERDAIPVAIEITTALAGNTAGSGLAYDDTGALLYVGGDGGANAVLYMLDDASGAETELGTVDYTNRADFEAIDPQFNVFTRVNSLTLRDDGVLYGIVVDEPYTYLVAIDPVAVTATLIGRTADLDGLVLLPLDQAPTPQAPRPPRAAVATAGVDSTWVGWSRSAVADSYTVYTATEPGVTPETGTPTANIAPTAFAHAVPADGTAYYYVVTASNAVGESKASAEVTASAGTLGAASIPFAPETGPFANAASPGGGGVTEPIDIGFEFVFFGAPQTQLVIAADGFVSFDLGLASSEPAAQRIPRADATNHLVAAAWRDLDVTQGGAIGYELRGAAPNRRFIVEFGNVASRRPAGTTTSQIILYEGSNAIEIHTAQAPLDPEGITQGVEDATGATAFFVPGRVANRYELRDDAVRFTTTASDP